MRFGALAGVLLWLQMLSSVYYGAFLGLIGASFALLLAATGPRRARSVAGPFCLAGFVAAILTAPYAIPYVLNTRALGPRDPGDVATFSARFASYVSAPEQNWIWGWTSIDYPGNELHLFPGLAAIALAVLGFVKGPRIARVYSRAARDRRCPVVGTLRVGLRLAVRARPRAAGFPCAGAVRDSRLLRVGDSRRLRLPGHCAGSSCNRGRRSRCSLRSSSSSASSTGRHR